jgi:phosphomannomutase
MVRLVDDLLARARAWISSDPDPGDRQTLTAILDRAASDPAAHKDLASRFLGPLRFGTAGLRGLIGAGESRMNRAVVRRATHGVVSYLLDVVPDARRRGIVIGRDGRILSEELQREAALVAASFGVTVHFLPGTSPTPLVAFGVKHLGAAAGITVTASHNPPDYNGYKVYFDNGAQIIPPHDVGIAARIDAAPPAKDVPIADGAPWIDRGAELEAAYLDAIAALHLGRDLPTGELSIAYTALHGVGEKLTRRAFERMGYRRFVSVPEQAEPDGRFPTVHFPNPEEPGAMDRVLALGRSSGSDIVVAEDPDADRLAAAVRDAQGRYVVLSGNEIGILLAHHLLTRDPSDRSPERLVVTTVVSSMQLRRIAAELGVRYLETLTGFKWIANAALEAEKGGARFVFGYEEALGFTVGDVVRDKDGIGSALVFAELAATERARGRTVLDRLREIRERFGLYVAQQRSLGFPLEEATARMAQAMAELRRSTADHLEGHPIEARHDLEARLIFRPRRDPEPRLDLPEAEGLIFELPRARIAVRPSGTEPKIKIYFEVEETLGPDESLEVATDRGRARIAELERAILRAAALSP